MSRRKKKPVTTTEWVVALNKLGAEMDAWCGRTHPNCWFEQQEDMRAKYRKLAVQPTEDRQQLGMFDERIET